MNYTSTLVLRSVLHLLLVPLMFMRASPVHTYLLDEVLAEMLGLRDVDRQVDATCAEIADNSALKSPAGDLLKSVPEESQPDPMKGPMVRASVPQHVDLLVLECPQVPSFLGFRMPCLIEHPTAPVERPPGAPPQVVLPLLI